MELFSTLDSLGLSRPKIRSFKQGKWDSWPANHPLAPWEMSLDLEQWERLASRSTYFSLYKKLADSKTDPDHAVPWNLNPLDEMTVDLNVPVFTKQANISSVLSPYKYDHLVEIDYMKYNNDFLSKKHHTRMSMHLGRILMAIYILIQNRHGRTIFDDYARRHLASFLMIASFLGSDYLFCHLAFHVVDEYNLRVFRQVSWNVLRMGVVQFEEMISHININNCSVQGRGFDEATLILSEIFDTSSHSVFRERSRHLREYILFWSSQLRYQCVLCGGDLRKFKLHNVRDGVQIMECCFSVACAQCYSQFLAMSHKCFHRPRCLNILKCFQLKDPFSVINLGTWFCPVCQGGYNRGFFLDNFTKRRDREKIRQLRRNNSFNMLELTGPYAHTYLSIYLRHQAHEAQRYHGGYPLFPVI